MAAWKASSIYWKLQSVDSMKDRPTEDHIVATLNQHRPAFIALLGGKVIAASSQHQSCTFEFCVPGEFCHSGDIVQGGFVTAMLDAAMAHAVFGCDPTVTRLSSLEISTRYESVTRGGVVLYVEGRIRKITRSVAFLEAELRSEAGEILACASSVAKVARDAA